MIREKQIEELAEDIYEFGELRYGEIWCGDDCEKVAKLLYAKGYRRQSEGEWISNCQTDEFICSLCGAIAPVDCLKEEFYKSKFCPNCGAKMKGGAE